MIGQGARRTAVFLGDSLTEFYDWQKRFPALRVLNLGVAGETVEGLLARLDSIQGGLNEAEIVFLMTGANNMAVEDRGFLGAYEEVVNRLTSRRRGSVLVVQSILPMILPWVDNREIGRTNGELRRIAAGAGAEYLDLFDLFMNRRRGGLQVLLLDDGVHLSEEGYRIWSDEVERVLEGGGLRPRN